MASSSLELFDYDLYKIQFHRLFEQLLEKLLYYMDPPKNETMYNNEDFHYADARDFTEKECAMGRSVIKLLADAYHQDPSPVNVDSAKSFDQSLDLYHNGLKTIAKNFNVPEIVAGKAPFQKFVLDCLLFTGKFMLQCMKKYKETDEQFIYNTLVKSIFLYLHKKDVLKTIEKSMKKMDPFGRISDEEYSPFADQFCGECF